MDQQPQVVMYDSPEAAKIETVTGWRARTGEFWGDNEHMARYCGSTHKRCDQCGGVVAKFNWCDPCHAKARQEKFASYPPPGMGWSYNYHRAPDSFELRECEIEAVWAGNTPFVVAPIAEPLAQAISVSDAWIAPRVKVASAAVEGKERWAFIAEWNADMQAFVTLDPIGPLDDQPSAVPDGWRETILSVLSALDVATGDSDPNIAPDLTDEEVREEYPEVWAMQKLSAMLAAAQEPTHG